MPLRSKVVDAFGYVTLASVGFLVVQGILCVVYVLYFHRKIKRQRLLALHQFNTLWAVRISLICYAIIWGLAQLLRLPLLRREGFLLAPFTYEWQAVCCRIFVVVSMGLAEPGFFMTAFFLVWGSLRNDPLVPRTRWNAKVVGMTLACCAPLVALQLVVVLLDPVILDQPERFIVTRGNRTEVFREDPARNKVLPILSRCSEPDGDTLSSVAVCYYPLLSTIISASFALGYLGYYLFICLRMATVVINKRLMQRLHGLLWTFVVALPAQILCRGFTVVGHPRGEVFEALVLTAFLTQFFCILIGEWILVVRPIREGVEVASALDDVVRRNSDPQEGSFLVPRGSAKVAAGSTPSPQTHRGFRLVSNLSLGKGNKGYVGISEMAGSPVLPS